MRGGFGLYVIPSASALSIFLCIRSHRLRGGTAKGVDKTWNLQTYLRTILIIVHTKTVSAVVIIVPCPLIRAMETCVELLSATQSIAFRQTN